MSVLWTLGIGTAAFVLGHVVAMVRVRRAVERTDERMPALLRSVHRAERRTQPCLRQ
jgi:uncharacterized membrane protein (DUF485 family)